MMIKRCLVLSFLWVNVAFAELAYPPDNARMQAVMQPVDVPSTVDQSAQAAIHQELRGLLHGIEVAINTQQYGDLKQYFDNQLHITTINQNVVTTPAGLDGYFKEWFGEGAYLKKLDIKLNADGLTQLYGDADNPTWGMVYGSGLEKYQLADGRNLDMKTRWTATVTKGEDGKWRILALHIGTNFYDNPIFHAVQKSTRYYAVGGLALGLLLGALGMAFIRRKKN
jgi:ketosteroid isomerase-like protein